MAVVIGWLGGDKVRWLLPNPAATKASLEVSAHTKKKMSH